MQQFNYKTHRLESSSDTAKPGKLIKQHYQGGAFFQVAKSSLLIPIPGFAHFWTCVCVWEREWVINACTVQWGHKTVWCPRVLGPSFSWKPSGACSQPKDQTSHLTSRPARTWRYKLSGHERVTWPRVKSPPAKNSLVTTPRCMDSGRP